MPRHALVVGAALVLAGCSSAIDRTVDGRPLDAYLAERMAIVAAPVDSGARWLASGCATAVTADGYFFTAGHVVDYAAKANPTQLGLALLSEGVEGMRHPHPARVVYRGGFDLAILRIESAPAPHFEWCDRGALRDGLAIAGLGLSGDPFNRYSGSLVGTPALAPQFSGGRSGPNWPPYYAVLYDAATDHGDSGGPIVTLDGRLVGVVGVQSGALWWTKRTAWRPELEWFERVIAKDRAARRSP